MDLATVAPGHFGLLALSSTVLGLEAVVFIAAIAIAVTIVVMNQKKKKASQPQQAAATTQMYPGVPQQQNPYGAGAQQGAYAPIGQPDPFAGFSGAPVAPPAPPPMAGNPPPGTPAGWLPDPSGAPNTLRYWDGAAWTAHVAARN